MFDHSFMDGTNPSCFCLRVVSVIPTIHAYDFHRSKTPLARATCDARSLRCGLLFTRSAFGTRSARQTCARSGPIRAVGSDAVRTRTDDAHSRDARIFRSVRV